MIFLIWILATFSNTIQRPLLLPSNLNSALRKKLFTYCKSWRLSGRTGYTISNSNNWQRWSLDGRCNPQPTPWLWPNYIFWAKWGASKNTWPIQTPELWPQSPQLQELWPQSPEWLITSYAHTTCSVCKVQGRKASESVVPMHVKDMKILKTGLNSTLPDFAHVYEWIRTCWQYFVPSVLCTVREWNTWQGSSVSFFGQMQPELLWCTGFYLNLEHFAPQVWIQY